MSNNSAIFQLCAVKRTRYQRARRDTVVAFVAAIGGQMLRRASVATDGSSRSLNRLFSALLGAILTLSPCLASAAGTTAWTIQLHRQQPYGNRPDPPGGTDFYGTQTYATKTLAEAAMRTLDTDTVEGMPAEAAGLKEQGISSTTTNSVTYQYSLPSQKWMMGNWDSFTFGVNAYSSEAAAVAAFTYGPCRVAGSYFNSSSMSATGGWIPGTGAPYNVKETRAYSQTFIQYDPNLLPAAGCDPPINYALTLTGSRNSSCPPPLQYSGLADNNCVDIYIGYVTGSLLECPDNGSPSAQTGDPCDVSTGISRKLNLIFLMRD